MGVEARIRTNFGAFALDVVIEAPGPGVTGLFGASGCGKTSILRCLAGLHRAEMGRVRVDGAVWQDDRVGVFLSPHHRGVGYVSQEADLFPHLSVRQNLEYGYRRAPMIDVSTWDRITAWLAVEPLLERRVGTLSGGERQRVALARALLASPALLLLDEPVSALDEPARNEVLGYLADILKRLSLRVFYVSHSLTEVARLADTIVWLSEGRVRAAGSVAKVLGQLDFAQWREEPGVVLPGRVRDHDHEFQLTTIETALGRLTTHRRPEPTDAIIRVQINARDVSIGLAPQESSSILNELPLRLLEITELAPSDCLARLGSSDAEGPVLLSRITRKSKAQLGLEVGHEVYARVKTVAVLD